MEVESQEHGSGPTPGKTIMPKVPEPTLLQTTSVAAFSGWKLGFAAGLSFSLTLLIAAGLFYGARGVSGAIEESHRRASENQSSPEDSVVHKEFGDAVRALADAMEHEAVVLQGPPAQVRAVENDIEDRVRKASDLIKTVHERQIFYEVEGAHTGLEECLNDIFFGGKTYTPPSICSDKIPSNADIEKAVNTPYTKY